ncbi:PadR family transcriptional regulator [Haloglycomyces albus]|uniref:PadR family transcriptional regulator n=1 Tax=Haloglycomyces albus TaxID=526067 RepID=UPI00046D442B|nr:PadR family transcriptional regulator [Haloglycomyces albus]
MLKTAILGFLRDYPLHGYDLKQRVAALAGHVRPIADGTLYPTIKRLEDNGLLTRRTAPGTVSAPRHMLEITQAGTDQLRRWLRDPTPVFITDDNRWYILLAFLHHLDNPAEQAIVLRQRLDFLRGEPTLFYDRNGNAVPNDEVDGPFRAGLVKIHRSGNGVEREWLEQLATELERRAGLVSTPKQS